MSRLLGEPPDLPGFRFVEHLGTGGFADVFKYEQVGLGREVAVKVLVGSAELDIHASFEVEASVMARLSSHPSIVSIYQTGTTSDGRPFLVMEYCPPPHLALRVRAKPLTVAKALEVAIHVAGAVETAHRLGILHRDIKPANILFTAFGRAALTDFGISVTTSGGRSGAGIGMSVPWAPPEQLAVGSPMGPTGDVYALAATMWTALVGRSPFQVVGGANDASAMAARVRSTPVPPTRRPDVPESLERALRTAMAKSPTDRYESAIAFARTLQTIQAELHQPVTPIDTTGEVVEAVAPGDDGGGTRISGFVAIDPEPPAAAPWGSPAPPPPPPRQQPAPAFVPGPPDQTDLALDTAVPRDQPAPLPHHAALAPASSPVPARQPRTVSPAVLVTGALVAGGVVAGIWLGLDAGDRESPERETRTAAPVDPIGDTVPAPTRVRVTGTSAGQLTVRWRPTAEPGDTYLVQVVKDRAGKDEVVVPADQAVDGTSVTLSAEGGNCVEVRTLRDSELSPWSERVCLG